MLTWFQFCQYPGVLNLAVQTKDKEAIHKRHSIHLPTRPAPISWKNKQQATQRLNPSVERLVAKMFTRVCLLPSLFVSICADKKIEPFRPRGCIGFVVGSGRNCCYGKLCSAGRGREINGSYSGGCRLYFC